jgi:transcriptional regulator with AAA-type ATPase domain
MPYPDEKTWDVLRALGSEPAETCIARLAEVIVRDAKAERAFVGELDDGGGVVRVWGCDLDGLPIAESARRLDAEGLRAAVTGGGFLYKPEVSTTAGAHGSRLLVARRTTVIVVEHRFKAAAFDHVDEACCARWLTMAEIALRLASVSEGGPSRVSPEAVGSAAAKSPADSTALPRRDNVRDYPEIIGQSPALRRALAELDAAVDAELPVLVEGETGTGKELFARALHEHGRRRSGPFVAVNCAAISDALFEAELFGHARGSFTGADRSRGGLLARAEGGTLLLDEIGELPTLRQAALLRVLEERRYRPVGSDDDRPFDVRIVAATNRDLDERVEDGSFRRDLLYRLRVLRVHAPPLRERRGDVELLLRHLLTRAGSKATIAPAALGILDGYAFPGNVRELSHLAQRLAASGVERIDVKNLPRDVRASHQPSSEREEVESALSRTSGNISRAATLLGLTRHGLKKKMLRLGLREKVGGS